MKTLPTRPKLTKDSIRTEFALRAQSRQSAYETRGKADNANGNLDRNNSDGRSR